VCCYIRHRFSYFSRRSIPSPPISSLIYGHLSKLWSVQSYSQQLRAWSSQYGSVYGLFEGVRPVYVVSDLDFIQDVFVSQFAHFSARRMLFIHRILGVRQLNVFGARFTEQWTRQRRILNPTYSISKMKQMLPTLQACTNVFMEKLASTISNEFINIQDLYLRMTLDIICEYKHVYSY
jgi:cytochrome P450